MDFFDYTSVRFYEHIDMVNYTESLRRLGVKIRKLRMAKNLSSVNLATKIGVCNELIKKIESGDFDCDLLTLMLIAETLDVELADLLFI